MITLNDYQKLARETAIYPPGNMAYLALGLNGEAGEVAEIVKRSIRKQQPLTSEQKDQLALELGDCLWYIANAAHEIGLDLEAIATKNIEKLHSRKSRNAIEGSGNYR